MDFAQAHSIILWSAFGVAAVMGAVVNKTNFCTMGAVSDWVNMGNTGRMRAWVFAMAVALIGAMTMEALELVNLETSRPPYRGSNFAWFEYVMGGVMFGIGMTLASGCGNKTLVRIGTGNLKSIWVLIIASIVAYYMTNILHSDTDETLYSLMFYEWTNPLAISLSTNQDLGSLVGDKVGVSPANMRMMLGSVIALLMLIYVIRSREFRSKFNNILGGLVVGLAVLAGWYASNSLVVVGEDAETWLAATEWLEMDEKPRSIGSQSFTFINPMGETLSFAKSGFNYLFLTFGVVALLGVIAGSLIYAIFSRSFRLEWFASYDDFLKHSVGAILMGLGGILALGCTIGQAITGISTLAAGSFLALASIVFGSALTMKMQFYRMMYEEAGWLAIFLTSLVDLRMLPNGLRKLEEV